MVAVLASKVLDVISHPLFPLFFPMPLFLIFFLIYASVAPYFATERQRAYILSTISSSFMTLASLPFIWKYARHGLGMIYEEGQSGWMGALGRVGVVFFATYLFSDLAIGYFRYPSQIGLLTGWIHHSVYIGLMGHLLNTRHSPVFLIAAIMELPTLDLAMSNLCPSVRHDLRFLTSFFIFRIAFHAYLLGDCLRSSSRAVTDGSWVPSIMLALAGALHVMWFKGGVTGYLKRLARSKAKTESVEEPCSTVGEILDQSSITTGEPVLESLDDSPGTPDDSPLMTPRTPSQTPFVLPAIPSITIPSFPTLSNLPIVSIPTIPSISGLSLAEIRATLNTEGAFKLKGNEFKEAVKGRWEEHREKFVERTGLSLGAMRMRRRGEPQVKEHVDEQADEGQLMTLPVGGHIGESQLDSGCT
ncbi:hypothetical protein C345_01336 [Cryptococcus neoformans A2-102-5]|uniref:TLC domain-containing protein n=1 Tax=Cryptococcus neoformans Tu259-1 TaxID=1230072 RepID=A0A854QFZ6_CRYNE|nr:hypothetical protein C368_02164 [Cryptococcus neoformans var. grubii 125.91]OXG26568.1 hypothetical protein C361_01327 [Cryptococcus neoformans var. grubii Tu259-1]OXG85929.1 hypothetical protein C350_01339 [Cryptococcus neoformans var. grubii MW-RSA36]OXG91353.1 hypothetical protein C346_01380 [Cryptococcus neoformans var. grubii D17-1]OXG98748.1 hypothetical protein C345_01336 [Cryptococcus neoformans var. grubii A2-102-5]OXL10412.1 hypothetical protein C348_01315 [Cryptococcus neoformans